MGEFSFEELFRKYYENKASAEEKALLLKMIGERKDSTQLSELVEQLGKDDYEQIRVIDPDKARAIAKQILMKPRSTGKLRSMKWWLSASAAAAVMIVLGIYWLTQSGEIKKDLKPNVASSPVNLVRPGGNKAILTLANGSQIVLDSAANGNLTSQASVKIIKLSDGQIRYEDNADEGELAYNTVSTPIGGQYQIMLADGSKVWLNAASSLRFPAAFTGTDRTVELKGEGYFEIAHDANKPFRVVAADMNVEVLGTHFNINAYEDEPLVRTTLLEGKVKIEKGAAIHILKPGQQAKLDKEGKIDINNNADLEQAVAWKNGKFVFNGNNIHSVMRQLSRWYDIKVEYAEHLPDDEFVGVISIPRSENISVVLNLLQKTKTVSFKVIGRTVIVEPYKSN